MSNPTGSDDTQPDAEAADATEVIPSAAPPVDAGTSDDEPERRYTAPSGFDGKTQVIDTVPEPATEVFPVSEHKAQGQPANPAAPQVIPGRDDAPKLKQRQRSWGWVVAVILVIAALVAVAILGTVLLTREESQTATREDLVRNTIQTFDAAVQKGDLATLRSITCGETADTYIRFDPDKWKDVHARVAAARQYPVVATIDQVVVHDTHAEANVTSFMAYDPSVRSPRSFDLEFRDDQWKICQAPQ